METRSETFLRVHPRCKYYLASFQWRIWLLFWPRWFLLTTEWEFVMILHTNVSDNFPPCGCTNPFVIKAPKSWVSCALSCICSFSYLADFIADSKWFSSGPVAVRYAQQQAQGEGQEKEWSWFLFCPHYSLCWWGLIKKMLIGRCSLLISLRISEKQNAQYFENSKFRKIFWNSIWQVGNQLN